MNPETMGMNLTDPLVENPQRDQEIESEYSVAADTFVRRLPTNFRFTTHGFILNNMDAVLKEKISVMPRALTERFKKWKEDSLSELHAIPTENNIKVARAIEAEDLESLYKGVTIGLDCMLDNLDGLELKVGPIGNGAIEGAYKKAAQWEKFYHVARIAAGINK